MEQKLLRICSDILGLSVTQLSLASTQDDIEEWDSLAQIRLVADIEEIFQCEIPFNSVSEIRVIGDFLPFIQKQNG